MIRFLKHINPRTKILFFAIILIMLPGAIISYLGLRSISQKTENLRAKYSGTVSLVQDKLENDVIQLEENLRNRVFEQLPNYNKNTDLKMWLRNIESEYSAFKHLFLVNADEGLISTSVSIGWNKLPEYNPLIKPEALTSFNMAENAEFIRKDFIAAIRLYQKALIHTTSSQEKALLLSRTGRCYFKMGKYKEGINEYTKILGLENEEITLGSVPATIVVLSQIANAYEALKDNKEQYNVTLELYQELINHPWDSKGGEYLYYLESASTKIRSFELPDSIINSTDRNIEELINKENNILEQVQFLKLIDQNILPEIEPDLKQETSSELQTQHTSLKENNSTLQLGYFKLPSMFQQSQLVTMGYQIKKDFILSDLFPEILASVELGKDVFVGILDENDSILYLPHNCSLSNYLVAENFSQLFVNWKVALFDQDGKSIEQLVGKEKQLYMVLFVGIIAVMFLGIFVTVRAVMHESEVSRMKSEFVSNVSHELKTPLTLIRMFGETLDTGIVTDEKKRREFYSIIRKESERLTHLINNVLDFSRMDTGNKKYNFEETDLVKVVRSSLEAYKFHIRDNGFEIDSELPDELVMLKIDKDAISQVLLNFFSNAVKYSEEKKYIRVEVRKDLTSAYISVTDKGVGISKEELKKIFDKFYRVTNTKAKKTRGSGLGLTLAKQIIEAHSGTIEVESQVGHGSKFTIRIPLSGASTK